MPSLTVTIRGAAELARALGDGDLLDDLLRPGFEKASIVIEGSAKGRVHRVTGKLQGSLGHHLDGHGADLEARIGPQPGLGQPRRYSEAMTSRWKKPRAGINRGDPQDYAIHEEQGTRSRPGHPFLEPSLTENIGQIERVITSEADRAMSRRFR